MRASPQRTRWLAAEILPHEPALRAWLVRSRVDGLEIDDIVQEAYAILVGLDTVEHIRNAKNYLFQTARSVVLRHLRRARIVAFQPLLTEDDTRLTAQDSSPEDAAIFRDRLREADRLLAALPERAREAFLLRRVQGLSQREIAETMQVSENTVEKHIGKALRLIMHSMCATNGGKDLSQVSNSPKTTNRSAEAVDTRKRLGSDPDE